MRGKKAKELRRIAKSIATKGNEMANKVSMIPVLVETTDLLGEIKMEFVEKEFTVVRHNPESVRGTYQRLKKAA